ncbi:MAG: DUF4359 domain-containing protein [Synechococcaceae bacterium WB8_1B_136]|nr:DUF4359 domain-containing protein [Synechococcaceae bacterium WB8_1B_136]
MACSGGGSWWPWAALTAGVGAALAWSNPGPVEFEAFAGEQLVELASHELCGSHGLPMVVQLVVRDCPRLIASQRHALGAIAAQGTHRTNLGLFSLYTTEVGGQAVLPGVSVPRYQALTLAGAGQLVLLKASSNTEPAQR